jgi:hypothetical protein
MDSLVSSFCASCVGRVADSFAGSFAGSFVGSFAGSFALHFADAINRFIRIQKKFYNF